METIPSTDRTLLLYLLDALQSAPDKARGLLLIAMTSPGRGKFYSEAMDRLHAVRSNPAAIMELSKKIREEMREEKS